MPEFALVRRAGLEPITQVLGSSVYHVGWQFMGGGWYTSSQELVTLSDAYNDCRRRAFDRLRTEAELAGADAVVGVRITAARYEWASDLIEFQAIGTAVRAPELRTPAGPALTNLSGQDCALLLGRGPSAVRRRRRDGRLLRHPLHLDPGDPHDRVGSVGERRDGRRHPDLVRGPASRAAGARPPTPPRSEAAGIVATEWGQEERPYESGDRLAGVTYIIHALATAIATGGSGGEPDIATVLMLSKES